MSRPEQNDAPSQRNIYNGGMDSNPEFREPLQTNIHLSKSQQEARQHVVNILAARGNPRIVLVGFSGVGKNVVLQSLDSELTQANAQVIDLDLRRLNYNVDPKRPAITTSKPNDLEDNVKKVFTGQPTQNVVVAGMDPEEISQFIDSLNNEGKLTKKQIIRYSMGIPNLAITLAKEYTTKDIAEKLVAQYLFNNLFDSANYGEDVNETVIQKKAAIYLRAALPWDYETSIRIRREFHDRGYDVYSFLSWVTEGLASLKRRGIEVESPLFVAPESEAIYNKTTEGRSPDLDIFVPEVSQKDMEYLEQLVFALQTPHPFDGPVAKVFLGSELGGKYGVYLKNLGGKDLVFAREVWGIHHGLDVASREANQLVEKLLKAYNQGAFRKDETSGLEASGRANTGSLLVHKHAHGGYRAGAQLVSLGWMTESLLQQRGIGYVVSNRAYEGNYLYNPNTKHIETLPETEDSTPSEVLPMLAEMLLSRPATESKKVKEFPDNIRSEEFYLRLKKKFGHLNNMTELQNDSLTLGDMYDIAQLYESLVSWGEDIEEIGEQMKQTIGRVAKFVLENLPDAQKKGFRTQLATLEKSDMIKAKRDDPIFGLPVNLDLLFEYSHRIGLDSSSYEISHYPGGIIIREDLSEPGKFHILLTQRNANDDPVVFEVFKETGLPVKSN